MTDTTPDSAILAALAERGGQPMTALNALGHLTGTVTGARLVTLTTVDPDTGEAERIFSSMPGPYPVSGRKPMNESYWSDIVIRQHQTFVANSIAKIAEVFFDHELIASLGCESVVNLPVVVDGHVIGTINCLDAADYWTPGRLATAETLRLSGAAVFLLHRLMSKGMAQ